MRLSDEAVAALARAIEIDAAEIARRKAFLEFGEADVRRLAELHEHIHGAQQLLVDEFYAHLLKFDETRRFIPDAESLERLKRAQAAYFKSLTAGDYGLDYVRNRLRVGIVHQRIGLEPKWYIGAYGKFLTGLMPRLWRLLGHNPQEFLDTYSALQKIVLFDLGLAIDTYIEADRRDILGLKQYAEDVIASLPAGLVVVNKALKVLGVNRSFRELFDLETGDEPSGRDLEEFLPLPGLREQALDVLASGTARRGIEAALGDKLLCLSLSGIRVEEEDRLLVVIEDVTERERLREEARSHERRFHDLVQGLDAIVWEAEVRGQGLIITFISDRAEALLGYPVRDWLGQEFWPAVVHPDDRNAVFEFYNRVLGCGSGDRRSRFEIEYRARKADGSFVWLHNVVHLTPGAGEGPGRLRGVMVDVTARKDMEARLLHLASHDALTGLPNRRLLHDRLDQALVYATRHTRAVAVLFLDLDRFKLLNDSLGHSAGDTLLKAVAERLKRCVRDGDTVARLGGDEFVVILEDMAQPQDAALVAQKILESFVQPFRIELGDTSGEAQEFFFTASIGISLYPGDGADAQALLKNAETGMYRAKEQGGNNYQFFAREMYARAHKRLGLENALHRALEQGQFVLHYQPQVALASGRIIGVEALVRWSHPEQGLVAPAEFIPLLEETGLIVPVGEWVLRTACAQAMKWRHAGLPPLTMAVNLSARQLMHDRFAESVARALADTGMDPRDLELEITESAVMQHVEQALERLRSVTALGVRLSIDDFGTGYSSLSHLKLLPISAVKIAQSFVRDIPGDENDAAIARAVLALARSLGLRVIAEGVETASQLEFLRAHGCDAIQGHLFCRALPAEELSSFLEDPRHWVWQEAP